VKSIHANNPSGEAERAIRLQFGKHGRRVDIPLMTAKTFKAVPVVGGIEVDNLGKNSFLSWLVFEEVLLLLKRERGVAFRGNAMGFRLGEPGLPLNSVEGHIAATIFGKVPGDTVFRRISPVAAIMVWAGLCKPGRGTLSLRAHYMASDV